MESRQQQQGKQNSATLSHTKARGLYKVNIYRLNLYPILQLKFLLQIQQIVARNQRTYRENSSTRWI